jgi:hypothetical protein
MLLTRNLTLALLLLPHGLTLFQKLAMHMAALLAIASTRGVKALKSPGFRCLAQLHFQYQLIPDPLPTSNLLHINTHQAFLIQLAAAASSCRVPYPTSNMWLTRTIAAWSPDIASCGRGEHARNTGMRFGGRGGSTTEHQFEPEAAQQHSTNH